MPHRPIRILNVVALLALTLAPAPTARAADKAAPSGFATRFNDATLRVDLNHTGAADEEIVALDRLHVEGPWAGARGKLVDTLDLGRYRARLLDAESGELLWSRGFDSYFGEWKTTAPAAAGVRRTYHESVRCPLPIRPAILALDHRGDDNELHEVFRTPVDPADPELRREPLDGDLVVVEAHVGGPTANCVDVVILGEGYTAADTAKFKADLQRFTAALLGQEPFRSLKSQVSVRGVLKPSQDSGCDEPSRGVDRRTALGCTFDSLGSERYLLTEDNRAIREAARAVPYDVLSIMVNHTRYGGGGIYNLFNTFTSDNQWSDYVFVHEFGHGFAGLADEYYSSSTAYTDFYPEGVEPVERNITRLAGGEPKWAALVPAGTPVPTPWAKAEYDAMDAEYQVKRGETNATIARLMTGKAPQPEIDAAIAAGEDLSRDHQARVDIWIAKQPQNGRVGVFEGAGYCPTGVYRSQLDCIMFTKGLKDFCAACGAGIREVTDACTDGIN